MSSARISVSQEQIEAFCRKWKIAEFRFFGSVLREDFRPESDVDVLVRFAPDAGHGLFDLAEMEEELAGILGRKVDLVDQEGVERSENYLRRRSILSGEPPADRDDAHLLDMLLAARLLREFSGELAPEERGTDPLRHDAILWEVGQLARAAGRVSARRRERLPKIPWATLAVLDRVIMPRSVPFFWPRIREIVPEALTGLIEILERVVPPEED
ncbi:MAG: nucleotidyltransferase domain-containing protein, partial [Dehalococcoidia bacterium]